MNTLTPDPDAAATLDALRLLADRPDLSQRQLSHALRLSLGKTQYVLDAMLDKGLAKIENFERNDNKLALRRPAHAQGSEGKLEPELELLGSQAEFERLRITIAWLRQEVHPAAASDPTL